MMNASYIVCLKFYCNQFMFINLVLHKRFFINLFKTASIMFLSYIFFDLLDDEHGTTHIKEKCKRLFSRPHDGYRPIFPPGGIS